MNSYDELEQKIKELDEYMNTEEYKNNPSKQLETYKKYVEYAEAQNKIKPYSFKKRQKIQIIKKVIIGIEEIQEMHIKSKMKYQRYSNKAKNFIKKVVKNAKRKETKKK